MTALSLLMELTFKLHTMAGNSILTNTNLALPYGMKWQYAF
jgi:hypothetical protein